MQTMLIPQAPATYASEHRRLRPVLVKAGEFGIEDNPDPLALFSSGNSGFNIWCTPGDCPDPLWKSAEMLAGAFSKPCELVGEVYWGWQEDDDCQRVTHLVLTVHQFVLIRPNEHRRTPHPVDVRWCKAKVRWLFKQAKVKCPPIRVSKQIPVLQRVKVK